MTNQTASVSNLRFEWVMAADDFVPADCDVTPFMYPLDQGADITVCRKT